METAVKFRFVRWVLGIFLIYYE